MGTILPPGTWDLVKERDNPETFGVYVAGWDWGMRSAKGLTAEQAERVARDDFKLDVSDFAHALKDARQTYAYRASNPQRFGEEGRRDLLREIAKINPWQPIIDGTDTGQTCHFWGGSSFMPENEGHAENCLWLRAKKATTRKATT